MSSLSITSLLLVKVLLLFGQSVQDYLVRGWEILKGQYWVGQEKLFQGKCLAIVLSYGASV